MMVRPINTFCDPYSLTFRFCYDICEEIDYHKSSRRFLTLAEYKILESYYHGFSYRTVKYVAHSKARLLKHVIHRILNSTQPPRILDASCGFGSEAIFFGLLGADVVGIDLHKERLDAANKRVEYYKEKYYKAINAKFYLRNILTFSEHDKFDIIWSNQFNIYIQ